MHVVRGSPEADQGRVRELNVARRRLPSVGLVVAIAVGMLVSGSPAVAATTSSTPQLQAMLLTVANLPPGWSQSGSVSPTTSSCYSNPIWKAPYQAKARAGFQMNNSVPQLVELLGSYQNGGAAYRQVVASLNGCSRFSETVQGQKISGTVSPMSNKRFGTASSSYTANLSVGGTSLNQEFVIARKGNTLAAIAVSNYGSLDSQLLDGFAATAMRKIPA